MSEPCLPAAVRVRAVSGRAVRLAAGVCAAWSSFAPAAELAAGTAAAAPVAPVAAPVAPAAETHAGQPPAAAATIAPPVEGVWERHELAFRYFGLTSLYACDALADKLERLLKHVGARPDARARVTACDGGFDRVGRFPSVRLTFHALVPADAVPPAEPPKPAAPARRLGREVPPLKNEASAPAPGVGAWRTVELLPRSPRWLDAGDCELVEQFAREVLPKFRTRGLDDRLRCTPGQVSSNALRLTVEVLGALPEADAPRPR